MSLETIEQLAKEHAADRSVLAERVQALHDLLTETKRARLQGIKNAASRARDSRLRLVAEVAAGRELFERPRTRVFHGIKVGLQKAKGRLVYANAEKVVELVRRYFPDQADVLVKSTAQPVKTALLQLPAADLKRLSCTIEDTDDQIVVAPVDSEIDKLVDAILGDVEEETEEA